MTKKILTFILIFTMLTTSIIPVFAVDVAPEENISEDTRPILLGDANGDGRVDISDATTVQRYIAGMETANKVNVNLADVNRDFILSIGDATYISRYLCSFSMDELPFAIDEPLGEYKDDFAEEVVALVNEERKKVGLNPLVLDEDLVAGAELRALEINWPNHFSHTRPDNSSCFTVFEGKGFRSLGENIARGYTSPESVMEGWMNSQGHKENILRQSFTKIGIACVRTPRLEGGYSTCWVQSFGSK